MFGTREALLNLRIRHLIDFRLLPENDEDLRWADRITWEGNLYDAFFRIYPRLVEPLKTPFKLEGPHRVTETPAHEALRECLVNMLAHADYAEQAALLVTASPREFVFRNPGSSRVPEEDLLTKDCSDPRNPVLLRMFRYVALADEAGTGLPKVLRVWRAQGLQLPSLHSDTERYEFKATLRLVHLLSEKDRAWLAWCAKANMGAEQVPLSGMAPLGPNEQLALIQARNEESVNNAAVQALTGLHRADVTQLLGTLRDRGLLEQESTRRWASYRLPDVIRKAYGTLARKKTHEVASKPIKKTYQEAKKPMKKKDRLIQQIIEFCHVPRSAKEIASALKKNPAYLLSEYLGPMIERGVLTYTNQASPNAPDQKYMAPHKGAT
jgi:predicted HTH transcriptional regulator